MFAAIEGFQQRSLGSRREPVHDAERQIYASRATNRPVGSLSAGVGIRIPERRALVEERVRPLDKIWVSPM
jgi:hypothetical protein